MCLLILAVVNAYFVNYRPINDLRFGINMGMEADELVSLVSNSV